MKNADTRIIRTPRRARYLQLGNEVCEDSRLSYKALGLLASLLCKPDNWICRVSSMLRPTDRRDAVRAALRELRTMGYVSLGTFRDDEGKLSRAYFVFETPAENTVLDPLRPETGNPSLVFSSNNPETAFPAPAYPSPDNPASDKASIYKVPINQLPINQVTSRSSRSTANENSAAAAIDDEEEKRKALSLISEPKLSELLPLPLLDIRDGLTAWRRMTESKRTTGMLIYLIKTAEGSKEVAAVRRERAAGPSKLTPSADPPPVPKDVVLTEEGKAAMARLEARRQSK